MELYQKIVNARKQKGFTQEQLADLSNVTVRTIQRVESGETTQRAYTLKAIASALGMSFEELLTNEAADNLINHIDPPNTPDNENSKHFLKLLCLSCFSYLVVPFIHILIPNRLLKKSNEQNPVIIAFAKKVIRGQLYWKVALWFLLLATLAYNLIMTANFQKPHLLNYLVPFFAMYFINAVIITINLVSIKKIDSFVRLQS